MLHHSRNKKKLEFKKKLIESAKPGKRLTTKNGQFRDCPITDRKGKRGSLN
jgi:hypothetical protein